MPRTPWTARPLMDAIDVAMRIVTTASVHGAYVHNALALGEGEGFVFASADQDDGLCWFGPRGNLVIVGSGAGDADGEAIAEHIQRCRVPWRIALGPRSIVDALRGLLTSRPLVHRNQVYYESDARRVNGELVRDTVRPAEVGDRDRLVQATLQLNHSDLMIEPKRVDRRWLYETIDERIAAGTTRVLGPRGRFGSKLDFGSDGPGGLILEGVFTFPGQRQGGLAASLVATAIANAPGRVGLHVGEHNGPARAAYERAGMVEVDRCRLLLLG